MSTRPQKTLSSKRLRKSYQRPQRVRDFHRKTLAIGHRQPVGKLESALDHERRAWEMRIAGATYAEIGRAIGLSQVGVMKCCDRVLEQLNRESLEDATKWRKIENARLNRMQATIWPAVLEGSLRAFDRMLRLMERRARLNGLDKPVKVALSGDGEGGAIELAVFRKMVVEAVGGEEQALTLRGLQAIAVTKEDTNV